MTDENTRLPSDSVVEDAAHRIYDAVRPHSGLAYWICELAAKAALAAQPRDGANREAWLENTIKLIAHRAQLGGNDNDDPIEALNWIYWTASKATDGENGADRIQRAWDTLYVNLLKTNPEHIFTTFAKRIQEGATMAEACADLDGDTALSQGDEQPDTQNTDGLAAELVGMLIEPSDNTRSQWDMVTEAYVAGLEQIRDEALSELTALRTDRKAVLEEAAKTAAEERLQEPQDESDEAYNRGARDAIAAIRALAEGAGK